MEEKVKDMTREELICEYEKRGWFDKDVENDPPFEPLDPNKFDWFKKKLSSKIMAKIATHLGRKFFEGMIKNKAVIFSGIEGLENLEGFKQGAVVTCNHIHYFDSYPVLLALKKQDKKTRLFKVVRDGNFVLPGVVGTMMKHADTLPINTDGRSPRTVIKCMQTVAALVQKEKNKVLIYPEQAMWFNYRKPRPLKAGAFTIAAKAKASIIPCFITLNDSDITGQDGQPVQEFTIHVLPIIHFNPELSIKENSEHMMDENYRLWKECYERVYKKELTYETIS